MNSSKVHKYVYDVPEFLSKSWKLIRKTPRKVDEPRTPAEFRVFLEELRQVLAEDLTNEQINETPWIKEYVESLAWFTGEYERLHRADPGAFYVPAHNVARNFHASMALWRFFCAGNRCSKTQSGYQEHYWVVTNQHPLRHIPFGKHATAIIGTQFQKYTKDIFEPKMITGEVENDLSPYFPEGGKWLRNYDKRYYRLTIACKNCANSGQAQNCTHDQLQSTISLYSNEAGKDALMGTQFRLLHFDEEVKEEFFDEGTQRLSTVEFSSGIVTGTPLKGPGFWTHRILEARAKLPRQQNLRYPSRPADSPPYAEYFNIDQYSAGIKPKDAIDAERKNMDDATFMSRVMGVPTALADRPVFDRTITAEQRKSAVVWRPGTLDWANDTNEVDSTFTDDVRLTYGAGPVWIREEPDPKAQYVIGVDTASGLDPGNNRRLADYSCAKVCRLDFSGGHIKLKHVAEYHGYIRPALFAQEVKKLGLWYNTAWVVVESTGGLGLSVLEQLRFHLYYPHLFQDKSKAHRQDINPIEKFGLDTNLNTKPAMVAAVQHFLGSGRLSVHHEPTLREMDAFTQHLPDGGRIIRYEASDGEKDDRVMALALLCYAVSIQPMLWDWEHVLRKEDTVFASYRPKADTLDLARFRHESSSSTKKDYTVFGS